MKNKVGRNAPCPCGSGRKYKQCCLVKDQAASRTNPPWPGRVRSPLPSGWVLEEDRIDEDSNRVLDLIAAGKLEEAEKAAEKLLELYPDQSDGFMRLGAVWKARGEADKAAEYLRKAADQAEKTGETDPELIASLREEAAQLEAEAKETKEGNKRS